MRKASERFPCDHERNFGDPPRFRHGGYFRARGTCQKSNQQATARAIAQKCRYPEWSTGIRCPPGSTSRTPSPASILPICVIGVLRTNDKSPITFVKRGGAVNKSS